MATAFCLAGCTSSAGQVVVREAPPDASDKAVALERFGSVCLLNGTEAGGPPLDGATASKERAPSVLLELAFLAAPVDAREAALPVKLNAWIGDPTVQLLATTNRSVSLERRAEMVIEERLGPVVRPSIHELSVDARITEGDQIALDLSVVLQLPSSDRGTAVVPLERRVSFVTAAHDRKPMVLSAPLPGTPGRAFLVLLVPYLVRHDRDLRAIFLCKMESQMRAMKEHPADDALER